MYVCAIITTIYQCVEDMFNFFKKIFLDRDQTQIGRFSPRHNVVVGRNVSGKSNFFAGELLLVI